VTSSKRVAPRRTVAALLLFAAILAAPRLFLLGDLAAIASPDSPGYASIALDLAQGDLFHPALGELRLPGYPLFLALLERTVGLNAATVAGAQLLVGLAGALAALRIVALAGGRLRPVLVALLFGLHPVFLFFERWWMSESLFVTSCLVTVWIAAEVAFAPRGFFEGAALGGAAAATALIRPNAVALVAVGAAGVALLAITPATAKRRDLCPRATAAGLAGCAVAFGLWMSAWLLRNDQTFGKASFLIGGEQSRLAYALLIGLGSDPEASSALLGPGYDPANPATIYRLLAERRTGGSLPTEAWAREKRLALTTGPDLRRARLRVLMHFFGVDEAGRRMRNLSNSMRRSWVDPDESFFDRMRATAFWTRHGLEVPKATPGATLGGRLGVGYLNFGRLLLWLGFALLTCRRLVGTGQRSGDIARRVLTFLLAAAAATALLHAWNLADLDRFAASFDWIALLGVAILLPGTRGSDERPPFGGEGDLGRVSGRAETER
jgi:hypothetical protein